MNRGRTKYQRQENVSRLDEFPDEFDDIYFYNHVVESDSKAPVLRGVVYKKIRDAIIDRVAEYKDVELEDVFQVDFDLDGFTIFQWSVIHEELLSRGFDSEFIFEDDKPVKLIVKIERKNNLYETIRSRDKNQE